MYYHAFLMIIIGMAGILALPVPDEEVAIQPNAGTMAELFGKPVEGNPVNPLPLKPKESELKAAVQLDVAVAPKTVEPLKKELKHIHPLAKDELKLTAPDVETAPAIPEAKPAPAIEDDKKLEKELIEASKAIHQAVKVPDTKKPLVHDSKSAVLQDPVLVSGPAGVETKSEAALAELLKPKSINAHPTSDMAEKQATGEQPPREKRIHQLDQRNKSMPEVVDLMHETKIGAVSPFPVETKTVNTFIATAVAVEPEIKTPPAETNVATPNIPAVPTQVPVVAVTEVQKTEQKVEDVTTPKIIVASVPEAKKIDEATAKPLAMPVTSASEQNKSPKKQEQAQTTAAPATEVKKLFEEDFDSKSDESPESKESLENTKYIEMAVALE